MDDGGIYEDGTPEQIFDNPQKDRTRRFIRHLKTFEETVLSRDFDFIGFNTRLEEFGRRSMMPQKTIYAAQSVFEELCVQTVLPRLDEVKLYVSLEYSEQTGEAGMCIRYGGDALDPFTVADPLSVTLIRNASHSAEYLREDAEGYTNAVTVLLK